ncbi:MAG: ArnT family glycosyltransferase [Ignavibacteriales bacterium]
MNKNNYNNYAINNKTLTKTKKGIIISILFLGAILITYIRGIGIEGPFIFLDETVYFKLGRLIHEKWSYGGQEQYNPLYPFLISFFFGLKNVGYTYLLTKLFNAVVFSSIIFPIYTISLRFFDKKISFIIAFMTLILPFSAITVLIWAEPLFYALYAWCILFYLNYLKEKSIKNGITLGLGLGLLFLTKQSAIILIIAICMSLIYNHIISQKENQKLRSYLYIFVVLGILIVPWLIRNLFTANVGLLGYKSEVSAFSVTSIFSIGFIKAFLYQLSYLTFSTYFIFFLLFILSFIYIKKFDNISKTFIIMIGFDVIGLLLLTAFHRLIGGQESVHLTFGRYLAPLIPLICIIGLYGLKNLKMNSINTWIIAGISGILFVNLFIFSPLKSIGAYSIVNNFDINFLNNIFYSGQINYSTIKDYSSAQALTISLIGLLFSLIIIMCIKYVDLKFIRLFYLLIPVIIYSSFSCSYDVTMLSNNTKPLNQLYKYLTNNEKLNVKLYYDTKLMSDTNMNINNFWREKEAEYKNILSINKLNFDFGSKESPVKRGAIKIAAPFDGRSVYSVERQFGFNFNDLINFDSRYFPESQKKDGMEDLIFGWKNTEFKVDIPKGKYKAKFILDVSKSKDKFIYGYDIKINDIRYYNFIPNTEKVMAKEVEFVSDKDSTSIIFIPHSNEFWGISTLEITPQVRYKDKSFYFITNKNNDSLFNPIYENEMYKLFYID